MPKSHLLVPTLLGALLVSSSAMAQDAGLPEDRGKAPMIKACGGCHEINRVTAVRRSEAEWKETVDDMIARGAQVADPDYDDVIAYLGTHFNPAVKASIVQP